MERFIVEKDIAEGIKREFDKRHGPTWHCVVGRHFGECRTQGCWLYEPSNTSLMLHSTICMIVTYRRPCKELQWIFMPTIPKSL